MWKEVLESKNFCLNRNKTEYIKCKFNKKQITNILEVKIGEYIIPTVSSFQYLWSIIQSNGEIDGDVTHRTHVGWMKCRNALEVICNHKIPNKLKWNFYRTVMRLAILYSSECWILKGQQE